MNTIFNKINVHLNIVLFEYQGWFTQTIENCLLMHIGEYGNGTELYKIVLSKHDRDTQ